MSLTKKTMIAYLKIRMLGMSSKDNQLSRNININHLQTSNDAGFYQKCKIDRGSVSQIIRTTESAREVHRRLSRPFGDDGWRLLPATRVTEYTNEMRTAKQNFENAVHDLEARWPAVIAKQQNRLASSKTAMFDPRDYPGCTPHFNGNGGPGYIVDPNINLLKYYKFEFDLRPTPDEGHIVIELENETIAELKDKLKLQNTQNLEASKLELWKRLIEPVKNMADICSNDKKVFKSLIKNIEKELDILKDLNVTNDIDMTTALNDVKNQLLGYTAGQIRDDKYLKKQLGKKAEKLTDVMNSYMSGSPN